VPILTAVSENVGVPAYTVNEDAVQYLDQKSA
jgi:hypothetical protein